MTIKTMAFFVFMIAAGQAANAGENETASFEEDLNLGEAKLGKYASFIKLTASKGLCASIEIKSKRALPNFQLKAFLVNDDRFKLGAKKNELGSTGDFEAETFKFKSAGNDPTHYRIYCYH